MNLTPLNNLLSKKMSRQEFLLHIGFMLIAITGISHMLHSLNEFSGHANRKVTSGYGSKTYGV